MLHSLQDKETPVRQFDLNGEKVYYDACSSKELEEAKKTTITLNILEVGMCIISMGQGAKVKTSIIFSPVNFKHHVTT